MTDLDHMDSPRDYAREWLGEAMQLLHQIIEGDILDTAARKRYLALKKKVDRL